MTRQDIALSAVARSGRGLEIGPSRNPLAPKSKGFDVEIVDHLDQAPLIEKYTAHGIDVSRIEPVDFVWTGGRLLDVVKKSGHYDYVIASHVIEHLPDPLGFLADAETILKPNGVLALVVPDKRYCFDYFKPVTTTGALIDATWQPRSNHTPGAVFDHLALSAKLDDRCAWSPGDGGEVTFVHDFGTAAQLLEEIIRRPDVYHDVHRWHFTPSSFKLIVFDLLLLKRTHLAVVAEHKTVRSEFYISLKKVADAVLPPDWKEERLRLARAVMCEQAPRVVERKRFKRLRNAFARKMAGS